MGEARTRLLFVGNNRSIRVAEMTVMPEQELQVDVAADGEVFSMRTPLVYKIQPRALHVVVPR